MWDYPRPPALVRDQRLVEVEADGVSVARTRDAIRILETSHPPSWYLPPGDVDVSLLVPDGGTSVCEWKGRARYWALVVDGRRVPSVAWSYPTPLEPFAAVRDRYAFYASALECRVDGVRVEAQPGGFYGGWITPDVVGPFKGVPGSWGW